MPVAVAVVASHGRSAPASPRRRRAAAVARRLPRRRDAAVGLLRRAQRRLDDADRRGASAIGRGSQRSLAQFEHVEWAGLALWDMIQPSFMFVVGAAAGVFLRVAGAPRAVVSADAWARRLSRDRADPAGRVPAVAASARSTNWTFEDVVTQIGLGYVFLFLLWNRGWKMQLAAVGGDPRRLLGAVRVLAAAGGRLRLRRGRAARRTTKASAPTGTRTPTRPTTSTSGF